MNKNITKSPPEALTMKYLFDDLKKESQHKSIKINEINIPDYITDNIKHNLLDFQQEVIRNFLFLQNYSDQKNKNHLMFNLATGSGKTLLMAMLVLYYYEEKKINNFVFLVNQTSIISKTEDNFLNVVSDKYLFKESILIKNKNIEIKKVDNFSDQTENIEIIFTTIHHIHNYLNNERENQLTLDILKEKNIVILSDESHHINADSKKWITTPDKPSWEKTVIQYLFKKNNLNNKLNQNVLLEFTATIPDQANVLKKYAPITIYQLSLAKFSKKGYSKNCLVLQFDWPNKQRIVLVLLLNWLRHEIALKNKVLHFKPVILFCSKNIEHSETEFINFQSLINYLKIDDFVFLKDIECLLNEEVKKIRPITFLKKFLKSTYDNNISGFQRALSFIKDNFQELNCLQTHSKNTIKDEDLINLESKENSIRAIFVVDKLKEGWDVLNLFDIVRLDYDDILKKNENLNKPKTYLTSDVQLIGRALRYYPFNVDNKIIINLIDNQNLLTYKRKFDNDFDNELSLLEEFYFHTYKDELFVEIFTKKTNELYDPVELKTFWFKDSFDFKTNSFFNNHKLYINTLNYKNMNQNLINIFDKFEFRQSEDNLTLIVNPNEIKSDKSITNDKSLEVTLQDFNSNLIKKAFNKIKIDNSSYFWLKNLKNLPNKSSSIAQVTSIFDFLKSYRFFEKTFTFKVDSNVTNLNKVNLLDQLNVICQYLKQFHGFLKEKMFDCYGTPLQITNIREIFKEPKNKLIPLKIINDEVNQLITKQLQTSAWYISNNFYGTDEAQNFITCFRDHILAKLKNKYDQVFLLKNEEVYKIYQFDNGVGFQPDFLLFLTMQNKHFLVLIKLQVSDCLDQNPKILPTNNEGFTNQSYWENSFQSKNQQFLFEINQQINQSENYQLIGLQFFNQKQAETTFHKYVDDLLKLV